MTTNVGDVHGAVDGMLLRMTNLPPRGSLAFADIVSALTRGYVMGRLSTASIRTKMHPETEMLVVTFASALRAKLAAAEQKHGRGDDWRTDDWEADCRNDLARQVEKGDPLDVAAYAAFCWARGWKTSGSSEPAIASDSQKVMILPAKTYTAAMRNAARKAITDRYYAGGDPIQQTPVRPGELVDICAAAFGLAPTVVDADHQYHVGPFTMANVFRAAGLTNMFDMQAVLDAIEGALGGAIESGFAAPANPNALRVAITELEAFDRDGLLLDEIGNWPAFCESVALCLGELKRLRALPAEIGDAA